MSSFFDVKTSQENSCCVSKELLTEISAELTSLPFRDIARGMTTALRRIGEELGLDRVGVLIEIAPEPSRLAQRVLPTPTSRCD